MAYIFDLVLILILVITIWLGCRRGFIRTMIQLVGCLAAFVIALTLSGTVAEYTFDTFISTQLQQGILDTLEENAVGSVSEQLDAAIESLPDVLQGFVSSQIDTEQIEQTLGDTVSNSASGLAEVLVVKLVRPLAVSILRFILFLILFILLMVVVSLIGKLIRPVAKLPLIKQADNALGAVLGALKGILYVLIVVTVVQLIVSAGLQEGVFTQENLDNSLLTSWVAEHNPIAEFIKIK